MSNEYFAQSDESASIACSNVRLRKLDNRLQCYCVCSLTQYHMH